MKKFEIEENNVVVTTKYVTIEEFPILYVSHQYDEEDGSQWQFHSGNDDYSMDKMQLVSLRTIINIDPNIVEVSDLPVGFEARRRTPESPWVYTKE
ncbi:immunity protein Imm33 domain-containing protein [Janthinobacterium sp. NFX145]|uniref:immunity protein Imm33 domain-containing protein n=1 Tax=Janthinobacterium sp. NFX145 TaxID=3415602 RepID=UPI003CC62415